MALSKSDEHSTRYDQKNFRDQIKLNQLTALILPFINKNTLWINQDATCSMGDFEAWNKLSYEIRNPGNGFTCLLLKDQSQLTGIR